MLFLVAVVEIRLPGQRHLLGKEARPKRERPQHESRFLEPKSAYVKLRFTNQPTNLDAGKKRTADAILERRRR